MFCKEEITVELFLGDHPSGQSKDVRNDEELVQERLLYWMQSLFWARFGGR